MSLGLTVKTVENIKQLLCQEMHTHVSGIIKANYGGEKHPFMAIDICDLVILCNFRICMEDSQHDYIRGQDYDQAYA